MTVLDLKTGCKPEPSWGVQLAAYRMALDAPQIPCRFDSARHLYITADGEAMPHVTGIMEVAGLCGKPPFVSQAVWDRKQAIGTEVHLACEYLDRDNAVGPLDPAVAPYVVAYAKFRQETKFAPELIERHGVAEVNGLPYGYTVDRTGELQGIGERAVLWLKPDATWKLIEYRDEKDQQIFLAALQIAWWKKAKKPNGKAALAVTEDLTAALRQSLADRCEAVGRGD